MNFNISKMDPIYSASVPKRGQTYSESGAYSREASGRRPRAKRVYNLVELQARVHHVNRAWS